MIYLENVNYAYGTHPVLEDINLTFLPGKLTAIVGPNGAGKSTLLKLMSGINAIQDGVIEIDGNDIKGYSPRELARKIAYVPQSTHLGFMFSVEEVVIMGRHPYQNPFSIWDNSDRKIVDRVLNLVAATALKKRLVNQLSGGEKQLVFLASALAQEPKILLLDEPAASLDINNQLQIYQILNQLKEESQLTVIVITHQIDLALNYADFIVTMDQGRVVLAADKSEVAKTDVFNRVFHIKGKANFIERIGRWNFVVEGRLENE